MEPSSLSLFQNQGKCGLGKELKYVVILLWAYFGTLKFLLGSEAQGNKTKTSLTNTSRIFG